VLKKFRAFLDKKTDPTSKKDPSHSSHQLRLATSVLLIEVARADHYIDTGELEQIIRVLKQHFGLDHKNTMELMEMAEHKAEQSTSYFEFSALINKNFSYEEKTRMIELMWQIALVDKKLDKYENHLIRKIANLIYVKREDIVRAKQNALYSLDNTD
jgi:uncharacterized tellurite resistance protein B-like protein